MNRREQNRIRNRETQEFRAKNKPSIVTSEKVSRHAMFAHIANAMWNLQRRLDIEARYGVATEHSFLLKYNTSKNFFPTIRRIILNKYGSWSDIVVKNLNDDLLAITEDVFISEITKIENPHLQESPSVVAIPEPTFVIRQPVSQAIDDCFWECTPLTEPIVPIPVTADSKVVFSEACAEVKISENDVVTVAKSLASVDETTTRRVSHISHDGEFTVVHRFLTQVQRGRTFDLLIFAPPRSGKTTFLRKVDNTSDPVYLAGIELHDNISVTNDLLSPHYRSKPVTLTDMPNLITAARFSIALVPSEDVYIARCRMNKLEPLASWYSELLQACMHADVVIYSDLYLSEVT